MKIVGIIILNGRKITYTDKEQYLNAIQEQLDYGNIFLKYKTIDKRLSNVIDDMILNEFSY